jgi:plasmid maintenance system antidote protein VapI
MNPAPRPTSRDRIDAGGTRLRLRALHVMGHGSARIARALHVRPQAVTQIVGGRAHTVSP